MILELAVVAEPTTIYWVTSCLIIEHSRWRIIPDTIGLFSFGDGVHFFIFLISNIYYVRDYFSTSTRPLSTLTRLLSLWYPTLAQKSGISNIQFRFDILYLVSNIGYLISNIRYSISCSEN